MEGFFGVIIWIIIMIAAGVSKNRKAQQKKESTLSQSRDRRTVQRPVLQNDPWAELKKIMGEEEPSLPQRKAPAAAPKRDPEWYAGEGFGDDLMGTEGYAAEIMEGARGGAATIVEPQNTEGSASLEGRGIQGEDRRYESSITSRLNVPKEEKKAEKIHKNQELPAIFSAFSQENWAQAVILAEIIGEPLARRPKRVCPKYR